MYPRLYSANAFTPRVVPQRQVIRTADAGNRPIMVVANRLVTVGTLNTLLFPTQAAYLATALTIASNDLPSYSFEYWDSVRAWRFLGGKVAKATISSNAQTDYVTLSLDFVFQQNDETFTTFSQPAQSLYPPEDPYQHVESGGNMTLAASAVTKYKSFNVTVANVLDGTWDELPYISALYYAGRDITFQYNPQYITAANRTAFKAQTPQTWVIEWLRASPSHNITFTCESSAYITNLADDIPLDKAAYQATDVQPFFDITATTDFAVTAS